MKNNKTIKFDDVFNSFSKNRRDKINEGVKYYEYIYALREARMKLGITQEALSKKTGLPRETIAYIESGRRNATLDKIIKVAEALNLEIKFIPK